jgi:hypothetical protein
MVNKATPIGKPGLSVNLLPNFYQTPSNKKFLQATIDQLYQPGTVTKNSGYIGRRSAKTSNREDIFIKAPDAERQNYQLEPGIVVKDSLGNTTFFKDYIDYVNQLDVFGGNTSNHARVNEQEFYSWDPHIDWDKFVNFQNYYWLPYGPETIKLYGQQVNTVSTYTVDLKIDGNSAKYLITPNGLDNNPVLKLYRDQTYIFEINSPGNPFSIKRVRSAGSESRYEIPGIDNYGVENGTIKFVVPQDAPNYLYYQSESNLEVGGIIEIYDITESSVLDLEQELLGKKTYVLSSGIPLSNGMKLEFGGNTIPESYKLGQYYVEGVGTAIKLVPSSVLEIVSTFTVDESIEFDATPFDSDPFDNATGFAKEVDYITINRASGDHNPWSRYNRWFHKDIIVASAKQNGNTVLVDQLARAIRPIIEFKADLKLFNYGTEAIDDIDLIDDFTTDIFSTIEGTVGYSVDGVALSQGQRVVFTADTDPMVVNRIYEVNFINIKGNRQIHLSEIGAPVVNSVALVHTGVKNKGASYWFNGTTWVKGQQKTSVNQQPLFDIVDDNGYSYGDNSVYNGSSFAGTSIFSYKKGVGVNDKALGFPLSYLNVANIGDIVFNFNLSTDTFEYKETLAVITKHINVGYLVTKDYVGNTVYENGWKTCVAKTVQAAVRIYRDTTLTNNFNLDIFDDINKLDDLVVRVYVNGVRLSSTKWTLVYTPKYKQVVLDTDIAATDTLTVRAFAAQPINSNGFYEIPVNLQNNPLNDTLGNFSLGEVSDHVNSIIDNLTGFSGTFPGESNLRDLGNITEYGTKFVQHSGPLSLSLYHITSENNNIVHAIEQSRDDYSNFKRIFLTVAGTLGVDTSPATMVDLVLQKMNANKPKSTPYYFTDMVPYGAKIVTDLHVVDYRIKEYPLSALFTLDVLSSKAVGVYLNGNQLTHGRDYSFTNQSSIIVTADIANGDIISTHEYDSTDGSFVPATPTKLGMWPKYEPKKYLNSALVTPREMIQCHDGSQVLAFGDYRDDVLLELETRIYNNIKVPYDASIFDISDVIPSHTRKNSYSLSEFNAVLAPNFYKWTTMVGVDFTKTLSYDRGNSFTYNYSNNTAIDGTPVPGYWHGVYQWLLGTDRPNICPWEMLGFSVEPTWWVSVYGPAPYTSDNLVMWEDIAGGFVKEPGAAVITIPSAVRPYLLNNLPVNENGDLISPLESGLVSGTITQNIDSNFVFGDIGPVEAAWRKSSHYPFSVLIASMLLTPAKTFGLVLDRSRIVRNLAGQLVYSDTNLRIRPTDIVLPSIYTSAARVQTAGIINYIVEYILNHVFSNNVNFYNEYKSDLDVMVPQLSYKVGAFTNKDQIKLLLESKTSNSTGNVFVPTEDYNVFLNKSSPIQKLSYSGIIVTKLSAGFEVRGYSNSTPYFKYYAPAQSGASLNIGGISTSFTSWASGQHYVVGSIVKYSATYFSVKVNHVSTASFDVSKFAQLPALPMTGGVTITTRSQWDRTVALTMPYGSVLTTVQEVADFIIGYGEWLVDQGFVFDTFNTAMNTISNWATSAKEFLFWTTQNWSSGEDKWADWIPNQPIGYGNIVRYNGEYYSALFNILPEDTFDATKYTKLDGLSNIGSSVISLSPAANGITFTTNQAVVDDIGDSFNNYEVLKVDGTPIQQAHISSFREGNLITYTATDGIYNASFYLVQHEHVIIINNLTIFNDTIYNPTSGYRQERIKVSGYTTTDWNGGLDIPGFIFDQAVINTWQQWRDYHIGDIISYQGYSYSADTFIAGAATFDPKKWVQLQHKPEAKILANWTNIATQFTDFYGLDVDSFDTAQQTMAQHLIGYQKRQYLENIIQDDVSEFKFFQGMIREKGTQNVLNKLFDALSSKSEESLQFYEEWALRVGNYGANDAFESIEFVLDEGSFKNNPQGFLLTNTVTKYDPFTIKQSPSDVYLKPIGYNSKPFPTTEASPFLRTAGYVDPSDVFMTLATIDDIVGQDITTFNEGAYVWCTFSGPSWNIYRFTDIGMRVGNVTYLNGTVTITADHLVSLKVGDYIGLAQVDVLAGFYKVTSVSLNKFTVSKTIAAFPSPFTQSEELIVYALITQRTSSIDNIDEIMPPKLEQGEILWTDDAGTGTWAAWKYDTVYSQTVISNTTPQHDLDFGIAIAVNTNSTMSAMSTSLGQVITHDKVGISVPWVQRQVVQVPFFSQLLMGNDLNLHNPSATVLAFSADGTWMAVGSPLIGNVSTKLVSGLNYVAGTNYAAGDIVRNATGDKYYQTAKAIRGTYTSVTGTTMPRGRGQTVGTGAAFTVAPSLTGYSVTLVTGGSNYIVSDSIVIAGTSVGGQGVLNDVLINVTGVNNGAITTFTTSGITAWEEVPYVPVSTNGTNSTFTNQGVVSLYQKDFNNIYTLVDSIISPMPATGEQFGSSLVFANDELYIGAAGHRTGSAVVGAVYRMQYTTVVHASTSYNPIGSSFAVVVVASTVGIREGMEIRGTGFTSGQTVVTVVNSTKLILSGSPTATPDGVLQFVTTAWSYTWDQQYVGEQANSNFGSTMTVSADFTTMLISASSSTLAGKVYVYDMTGPGLTLKQTLMADSLSVRYGQSTAVSDSADYIAIADDTTEVDDVAKVSIYKSTPTGYVWFQDLVEHSRESGSRFGNKIAFMHDYDTIVVYSQAGDTKESMTFDTATTTFDMKSTDFVTTYVDSGRVDVYDRYATKWVFSESLPNISSNGDGYGTGFAVGTNHILVSAPYAEDATIKSGVIYDYAKPVNSLTWTPYTAASTVPDVYKIKTAFLYNKASGELVTYVDVIDPMQGKIAGIADEEIRYKTYYDPAIYSTGDASVHNVNAGSCWTTTQVGTLWWDLRTAKFVNSYIGDVVYKTNAWNTLATGASIDVYEWVESPLLPANWDAIADTPAGLANGISGTSLYGNTVYSKRVKYDNVSKTEKATYYYWVKNKNVIPDAPGRHISANGVAKLIENPRGQGYTCLAITGVDSFSLVNAKQFLADTDVVLSIEYWLIDKTDQNIHSQWKLISDDTLVGIPNTIEQKWFDSLCGSDKGGRPVPDMAQPPKLRYGIENRPRQSMFVNRIEALKQFVEEVNTVLLANQITENYNISALNSYDKSPSIITGLYDAVLDTDAELRFANVGAFKRPSVKPLTSDGKIVGIEIIVAGTGYVTPPKIMIHGAGNGADVVATINAIGQITGAVVLNGGEGYVDGTTTCTVRDYSVLINSDSVAENAWSIYSYDPVGKLWSRTLTQSYDVRTFWNYVDWFDTGYNQFSAPDHAVATFGELNTVSPSIGELVKVLVANTGGWVLLSKYANSTSIDWTQSYTVVGIQNGTIQLSKSLYDFNGTAVGYDASTFDGSFFDIVAAKELRIILDTLRSNILIGTLKQNYVKLFLSALRYAHSEQLYLDWAFKTSFIRAKHAVGSLDQPVTYPIDNLADFENYVAEVKPYRTKVREYVSTFDSLDVGQSAVTDFDLQPVFRNNTSMAINANVVDGEIQASDPTILSYPWKFWLDSVGFSVVELTIVNGGSGYLTEPTVTIVGHSKVQAVARAFVTNGRVNRVILEVQGEGYFAAPTVEITGGGGTGARIVAIIGDSVVRSNLIAMKFDRVTHTYLISDLQHTETMTGATSKLQFPLQWGPDVKIGTSTVTVDGIPALRDSYLMSVESSTALGYTSYSGAITFDTAPAAGSTIVVTYLKDITLLNAADRVQYYYAPGTGQLGKQLSQLMTGIDYGGVQVNGLGFGSNIGWDQAPYATEGWDMFDSSFNDYITQVSENTTSFTLPYTPTAGTELNVYYIAKYSSTQPTVDGQTEYGFDPLANGKTAYIVTVVNSAADVVAECDPILSSGTVLVLDSTAGITAGMAVVHGAFASKQTVVQVVDATRLLLSASPEGLVEGQVGFTKNAPGNFELYVEDTTNISIGDVVEANGLLAFGYKTTVVAKTAASVTLSQIIFNAVPGDTSIVFTRTLNEPVDVAIYSVNIELSAPVPAGSIVRVDGNYDPIRLDDQDYGLDTVTNPYAVMLPLIADGITSTFSIPSEFTVNAGDTFIIRQSTSDGSLVPQDATYDASVSGGDFAYASASGLNPEDIIVDGDGFVTPTSSPAPEEVVPGQVVDAVAIKVFDTVRSAAAGIAVNNHIADGTDTVFKMSQQPNSNSAIIVKVGNVIKTVGEDNDYTVDYRNSAIILNAAPTKGAIVSIFSIGFSGTNVLDLDHFIGNGITDVFVSKASGVDIADVSVLVYVDGVPVEPTKFKTRVADGYDINGAIALQFATPPADGALINYVIVDSPLPTFAITRTETLPTDGSLTYTLQYPDGNSLPNESNMIVRVDQTILAAPDNIYFTIGSNRLNYTLDPVVYPPNSVSNTDINVDANGVKLRIGIDYDIDLSGITVKINRAVYKQYAGKRLTISITTEQGYSYDADANTITFTTAYDSNNVVQVMSSYIHDSLAIERSTVTAISTKSLVPDSVEQYYFSSVSGGTIELTRAVADSSYVWIVKNGTLLVPNVDYKLNDDHRSITLGHALAVSDKIEVITFGNNELSSTIAYMQFKDMLNRTHFKRLSLNKQTRLQKDLRPTDLTITLIDGSNFAVPSGQFPGVVEIRGERIEYGAKDGNVLSELRRATLGTGAPAVHRAGTHVQDIGITETIPYMDKTITEQYISSGSTTITLDTILSGIDSTCEYKGKLLSTSEAAALHTQAVEVFVGGYDDVTEWAAKTRYEAGKIVTLGAYTYKCVTAHTSSAKFTTDMSKWTFFIGNIRLKKAAYSVHNINKDPYSPAGDVEFGPDFVIDSEMNQLGLTNELSIGTHVTIIKRVGTAWDRTINIRDDSSKIANFIKATPGIWYSNNSVTTTSAQRTFDSTSITFDNNTIKFNRGN